MNINRLELNVLYITQTLQLLAYDIIFFPLSNYLLSYNYIGLLFVYLYFRRCYNNMRVNLLTL